MQKQLPVTAALAIASMTREPEVNRERSVDLKSESQAIISFTRIAGTIAGCYTLFYDTVLSEFLQEPGPDNLVQPLDEALSQLYAAGLIKNPDSYDRNTTFYRFAWEIRESILENRKSALDVFVFGDKQN